ncbi:MAG: hypothetical protein NTX50_13375 [Candidatus Sumerlaeota bacterium]|nr:hypothetical protein [Candidatus Sumerlaeota bacterium]
MAKQEPAAASLTLNNTKKELLDAYNLLLAQMKDKRETEMKPEQKAEEKQIHKAIETADALSLQGIGKEIGDLKSEIGKTLAELADKLEEETAKYLRVKKAVEVREKELQEFYEIEKTAMTLAALLETQQQKRRQFEAEIAAQKEQLKADVETVRAKWDEERLAHDIEIKERDTAEKKKRDREAEEFKYRVEREQQLAREQFDYEKARMERELAFKKEQLEKDLVERERALAAREAELAQLRERAQAFPKELETAVAKAVKEASDRLTKELQAREELLKKEYQGEQKVLTSRIESLQASAKEQTQQIARLTAQLEKSYGQVQDIAVKAIEGSAGIKAPAYSASASSDPVRRAAMGGGEG